MLDEANAGDAAPPVELLPLPELAWSRPLVASGAQRIDGIDVDGAGNIYLAGKTTASIDLGGGALPSFGASDVFVASYDADGAYRWSRLFGGVGADQPFDIAADDAGNVYSYRQL